MNFHDLTTEEAAAARERGAVLILPVGAVEPHGPHLPLATDILIAEETSRRAARALEGKGIPSFVLPAFPYGSVAFGEGFAGSLGPSAATAGEILTELLVSALEQGGRAVAVVSLHFDPDHVESLRSAVALAAGRSGRAPVFPDFTRRSLASRLTEEFQSGACHAGRFETSLVLAVRPDLVREDARRGLPAVGISLVDAIRQGRRSFKAAGIDRAYCGDPAAATVEEGESTYAILSQIVVEEVLRSLQGRAAAGLH